MAMTFLDLTSKVKATKAKLNPWDYIQLKSFCTAQDTIHKMKRPPTEWTKISANQISDKRVIPKIHNELIERRSKKKKKSN